MDLLKSELAQRYRAATETYCALIDERGSMPAAAWMSRIHAVLPELYAAALALPEIEPDTTQVDAGFTTHGEWHHVYTDLTKKLGQWNYYWDVLDPYDNKDRDPTCGSLADDLADIYRDVLDGRRAESTIGKARPNDVMWYWRFGFISHWSRHASGALRALGNALFVHYAGDAAESKRSTPSSDSIAS
jgi:hypothetical protein